MPQQAKRPLSGKTKSSVHLFVFPVVLSLGPVLALARVQGQTISHLCIIENLRGPGWVWLEGQDPKELQPL
jgi:hypothetical protein